jgi:hypothetical protein
LSTPTSTNPFIQQGQKALLVESFKKAETRYESYLSSDTPSCLSDLHGKIVKAFYYQMKYFQAASNGDIASMNNYLGEYRSSVDEATIEIDTLVARFNQK